MQRLAMLALAASALVMASLCATASAHSASDGFLDVNSAGRQLLQTDDNPKKSDDDKLKCTGTVSVPVAKYEPAAFPPTYWTCTEDNSKTSYGCALLPRPCFCLLNFKPVCSADGKTFGNECQAKCANVKLYTEGACPTAAPTATTSAPTANCICTADFKPVCGADGRTYSNACRATCAKVTYTEGACPTAAPTATTFAPTANCICTADFKPVCGADGRTYSNACRATCAKVTYTEGACPTAAPTATTAAPTANCICPLNIRPVCGADGATYQNACRAGCAKVTYTEGACPTAAPTATTAAPTANCICTADFKPVCGADGRTYSNACRATCAKVTFTEGACPTAAPTATPNATPTAAPTGTGSDTKMPTAAPTPRKPQPPKCYQTKKALCCDAERSEVNKQYSKKDGYKCEKNGRKFRCCRPYEKVCFTKKFKRGSRKCCYDRSKKFKDNRKYTCFSDSHQGVKGEYCYKY